MARSKSTKSEEKERTKQWEKKFQEGLEKVPIKEREQKETEIHSQKKRELQMAKQNLWKLRNTEKKLIETEQVLEIQNMEKKGKNDVLTSEKERENKY